MVPVCTTKEYHCFWEPVSLKYNVSGTKFLPSILNVIVYSESLQQMVEYFRCMYRTTTSFCRPAGHVICGSNAEANIGTKGSVVSNAV